MSHVDEGALHAYLDGELPPAERARLDAHVAECPTCRTRLEEERALVARASSLLGLAQPPERAVPPLHQLRSPLGWRLRVPLAWAASVVLALGLGYYVRGASLAAALRQAAARVEDSTAPARDQLALQDRPASPPVDAARVGPRHVHDRRSANQVAARDDAAAERTPAPALFDSAPAASGVVAIQPKLAPREPTPTPVPSAAVVTSRATADLAEERGRLVATQWPIIRQGPAREILGADPVGIPGLAVRNIRRSPTGEVVLVEQAIDSATVIQIFQERMEDDRARRAAAFPAFGFAGKERLARFVGGLRVEIAGPLSTDSLNRLLEQLKPIRP
jgi:hypothetical protein